VKSAAKEKYTFLKGVTALNLKAKCTERKLKLSNSID
jgi:hypothetical protein